MASTMLCNAPGVRREASLTILFTTHKMDPVYTATSLGLSIQNSSQETRSNADNAQPSWVTSVTTKCHYDDDDDNARCEGFPMTTQ